MMAIVVMLLVVVAGLVARASLSPSLGMSSSVSIEGTSEKVWAYLTLPEHRVRWQTGITDVVPLIDDEMMMGARNLVLKKIGAGKWEIEEEVVEFAPQDHLVLAQTSEQFSRVIEYRLVTDARVVVLEVRVGHTWTGFTDRFLAPFNWFSDKAGLDASLARLKELVEAD